MNKEFFSKAGNGYILAVFAIVAAIAIRWPLYPTLSNRPYLTMFGAVALVVWVARWKPATLAAVLGFFSGYYIYAEPTGPFRIASFLAEMAGYALSTGSIILFGEAMHRARDRAEHSMAERAAAEFSEREQKELLRVTLGSIGDGVVVADETGLVSSLNTEAERLTGWRTAEARGRPLSEVFRIRDERTGKPAENPVDRVFRDGTVVGLANHTILETPDGRSVAIDDSAAPIRRPDGSLAGVILVFRDVTEERIAQHARSRLAAIVEHSGEAIVTKNLDGIVQTWNNAAGKLFGYRPDEIVGKSITMLIPRERLDEETRILSRIREGHPIERLETRRMHKDGHEIPVAVSVSPIRDADGHIIGASKIVRDITEILAAREALARERELLQTTLASIGDAVITTDVDARITFLNTVAESVSGWKSAEVEGQPLEKVFNIVNEDTRRTVENPVAKALAQGVIVGLANHTILIRKDGKEVPIDDSAAPIHDSSGRVVGCVLVFRDITRRRRAEQKERAALKEAEEASRLKDEFLATLSHELRTPHNAILGWSRVIEESPGNLEATRRGIEVITRNARFQVDLVADLLDMSRIVSGKLRLEVSDMDLVEVIRASLDGVRHSADAKNIRLDAEIPDHAEGMRGDPSRLQQILWNLLSNAIKFTPENGTVSVRLASTKSRLNITVSDTGAGITPEFLPHLFERFRQEDSSISRQHGGLGLGLAIVKHLVELHGGTVIAKSEGEGRGSTFVVDLPRALSQGAQSGDDGLAHAAQSSLADGQPDLNGIRILAIDDEMDTRELLVRVLEKRRATVIVANSAQEGLEAFEQHQPHLILCDIAMPGTDGYRFLTMIRDRGDRTPAVAVTAFARTEDRLKALRAGFQGHLAKPVEPSELIATVAAFVGSALEEV